MWRLNIHNLPFFFNCDVFQCLDVCGSGHCHSVSPTLSIRRLKITQTSVENALISSTPPCFAQRYWLVLNIVYVQDCSKARHAWSHAKPFGAGAASQQGDVTDDDDESLDLMEALEASLRSAEEDALRQRQTQLRQQEQLNGCCVVCLGHMHGGVHCINPVQTAEGEGPAHFLCKGVHPPLHREQSRQRWHKSDRRLAERRAAGHCFKCPCSPTPLNCAIIKAEKRIKLSISFLSELFATRLRAASFPHRFCNYDNRAWRLIQL